MGCPARKVASSYGLGSARAIKREGIQMSSALLQEQLDLEKRALAIRMAVLEKKEFVAGALAAFAGELQGSTGKPWRELKAELKIGQL